MELSALARLLRREVRVAVLKGGACVIQDLATARRRLPKDVDLLVSRDDLRRSEAALLAAGWQVQAVDDYADRYYRKWSHELPPMRFPGTRWKATSITRSAWSPAACNPTGRCSSLTCRTLTDSASRCCTLPRLPEPHPPMARKNRGEHRNRPLPVAAHAPRTAPAPSRPQGRASAAPAPGDGRQHRMSPTRVCRTVSTAASAFPATSPMRSGRSA